jgi:uncharacterized protein
MAFPAFEAIDLVLAFFMFLGAALYTSVGHAGASAYIALMALFSLPVAVMRPTALVLNIIVSAVTSIRFAKAGLFHWRTLWPVLLGSIPFAYLGGSLQIPGQYYKPLVGVVLLLAAARLLWKGELRLPKQTSDIPIHWGVLAGVCIGLLSGLTGTGGGIFLSPLLLMFAWAEPRIASGVAAVFILCNSIAGLLGNYASVKSLPAELPLFAIAVLLGALVGTTFGINRLATSGVLRALGFVLLIAGFKLIGLY